MKKKNQLVIAATMTAMLPLAHSGHAIEQPSFQIAQKLAQSPAQQDQPQRREQRQERQEERQKAREQRREQRQQAQEQKQPAQAPQPAAQEQRQERRQDAQERRQEQRQQAQEQKQPAQAPQPAAQDQRRERRQDAQERRQERRQDAQERRQDRAQERRQDQRQGADQRPNAQERRQDNAQERREDTRDSRQDRREDVRDQRQERREDARDRRDDAAEARRLEDLRDRRRETREGNRTVIREPGRTIIREDGRTIIRHDEVDRFRRLGQGVRVERRGNEIVAIVERPGYRIVTITDGNGRLIRRIRRYPNGREVVIIDNRLRGGAAGFFVQIAPPVIRIPRERYIVEAAEAPPALLYDILVAPPVDKVDRAYALDEIRYTQNLRERMPRIDLDTVTFETGSWDVAPAEAARLEPIAQAMRRAIERNQQEVFLIEGHTDAVGEDIDNLSLSDRRAESVAIVLTDKYGVPPENLTTQGYGEQYLKVDTQEAERRNRRVTVRRITPLLAGQAESQGSGG